MSQVTPGYDREFVAVVGVDGSRASLAALATACAVARSRGGIVHAVHTVSLESLAFLDVPLDLHEEQERFRALCREQSSGVAHVVAHVALARPEQALDDLAREVGAEVIVVGTRRRSPLQKLLHGSTADRLVRAAHCPVLIVHDDDDADARAGAPALVHA